MRRYLPLTLVGLLAALVACTAGLSDARADGEGAGPARCEQTLKQVAGAAQKQLLTVADSTGGTQRVLQQLLEKATARCPVSGKPYQLRIDRGNDPRVSAYRFVCPDARLHAQFRDKEADYSAIVATEFRCPSF
jgi:hypothetical protein